MHASKGHLPAHFKCVECMPVWLLAWGNGSRTARGGLGCRSQAGLLGLNGEGVGRRACDSAECLRVGAGVSLAGGNGVVGSRRVWLAISARAGHLSRTDARSLRPYSARVQPGGSTAPRPRPVVRNELSRYGCAMPCPRAMAYVRRNGMLLPPVAASTARLLFVARALLSSAAGDGRRRDPYSCRHGSAASVHYPGQCEECAHTPCAARGASPPALSADSGACRCRCPVCGSASAT